MNTETQTSAPVMVVRNGRAIEALTLARVQAIINGTRVLRASDNGKYIDGLKVIGDGNYNPSTPQASGKVSPASFIYNISLVSEVALSGNKYQQAVAALKAAGDDVELVHDACNDILNAVRVSFNTPKKSFTNGQLVKGMVAVITTEKGSLIKLENVTAMPAESANTLSKGLALPGLDSTESAIATAASANPFASATPA